MTLTSAVVFVALVIPSIAAVAQLLPLDSSEKVLEAAARTASAFISAWSLHPHHHPHDAGASSSGAAAADYRARGQVDVDGTRRGCGSNDVSFVELTGYHFGASRLGAAA